MLYIFSEMLNLSRVFLNKCDIKASCRLKLESSIGVRLRPPLLCPPLRQSGMCGPDLFSKPQKLTRWLVSLSVPWKYMSLPDVICYRHVP